MLQGTWSFRAYFLIGGQHGTSCPANAIQMGQATWAIWWAMKRYSCRWTYFSRAGLLSRWPRIALRIMVFLPIRTTETWSRMDIDKVTDPLLGCCHGCIVPECNLFDRVSQSDCKFLDDFRFSPCSDRLSGILISLQGLHFSGFYHCWLWSLRRRLLKRKVFITARKMCGMQGVVKISLVWLFVQLKVLRIQTKDPISVSSKAVISCQPNCEWNNLFLFITTIINYWNVVARWASDENTKTCYS